MKYLGIEITTDGMVYYCREIIGSYMGLDGLKRDIRKLVLPTYKPTKTLAWLEEQTGFKWVFNNIFNELHVNEDNQRWLRCYDFVCNIAFVREDKIGITIGEEGEWVDMTPREFIDKIAKGEWI